MLFSYELETFPLRFSDVEVSLTAARNFEAKYGSSDLPFGSALWPAALALADALVSRREALSGQRAIELGCGLGLGSIIAAKVGIDIVATDIHPDMGELFQHNAKQNQLDLRYESLDWAKPHKLGLFPLIIASDVLYENHFANLLLDTFERTLAPGGHVLMTDPQRQNLPRFEQKLTERGYQFSESLYDVGKLDTDNTKGAMSGFVPPELPCKVLWIWR